MKKFIGTVFILVIAGFSAIARQNGADMAFDLRQSGKIYVVVSVIVVVFIGIVAYLFNLDGRLKKIERRK